jgi:hypothetical protein
MQKKGNLPLDFGRIEMELKVRQLQVRQRFGKTPCFCKGRAEHPFACQQVTQN